VTVVEWWQQWQKWQMQMAERSTRAAQQQVQLHWQCLRGARGYKKTSWSLINSSHQQKVSSTAVLESLGKMPSRRHAGSYTGNASQRCGHGLTPDQAALATAVPTNL
jgi:hypothetical protein